MTRIIILSVAGWLAASGLAVAAHGETWTGNANLLLGSKTLDKEDWGSLNNRQGELGVQTDFGESDWPLNLAADLLFSGKDATFVYGPGLVRRTARTSELDLGVRKTWAPGPHFRPFLGGGLAIAEGYIEDTNTAGDKFSDRDGGIGPWLGGGVSWLLGSAFNIGLQAKVSHARIRLFGDDKSAGGFHFGLLMGYHWGG